VAAGDAFLLTSQFAAAGLFLLLACVLLAVRFNSRVNRAFAVFLMLRGAYLLFIALARWQNGQPSYDELYDTARYLLLAQPFALAYFAAVYIRPQGGALVRSIGVLAILGAVIVESMFLVDHCTAECTADPLVPGPLMVVLQATPLAEAIVGMVLVVNARRQLLEPRGKATAIVAAAFTLLALLERAAILVTFETHGWRGFHAPFVENAWIIAARLEMLAALMVAALAALLLTMTLRAGHRRRLFVGASVVVLATSLYLTAGESSSQASSQGLTLTTFLYGLWRLLGASLVAYALVRHRFLDLDLRINWTISRGTVVAILVSVFLVVFKVIENKLNAEFGIIFGGVATGLLMLAIKPLEKLGDRVADGIVPRGRRRRLEMQQKLDLFQEQAVMVWSDGHIGRKERLLLDSLRDRLGIEAAAAARIEHEAAAQAPFSSDGRALSTQT
jgi:hypothetical protein